MKIAIIGTGYVGLVSGVCLSDFGHNVVCVDKSAAKIDQLNAGQVPIYEPGLDVLLDKNAAAGRLAFTTQISDAVDGAEAVFIAVGTPSRRGNGHADLTYVYAAAEDVANSLTGYAVVITKSTVPVGTNRGVAEVTRAAEVQKEQNDRCGGEDRAAAELGWCARRGLDEMLADHWRWQAQNPEGYQS